MRTKEQMETLLKPEIVALSKREGQMVSVEEWDSLYMNSYERSYLLPFCDNEVLLKEGRLYIKHSMVTPYPSTYDEVIVSILFPLVCTRLAQELKCREV